MWKWKGHEGNQSFEHRKLLFLQYSGFGGPYLKLLTICDCLLISSSFLVLNTTINAAFLLWCHCHWRLSILLSISRSKYFDLAHWIPLAR